MSTSNNDQIVIPRSAEEITAGVVPIEYWRQVLDPRRYGAAGDGVTDDIDALG